MTALSKEIAQHDVKPEAEASRSGPLWEGPCGTKQFTEMHCNLAGVYQIRNKKDNKVYIGGAYKNFKGRKSDHFEMLRSGRHTNIHLQRAWNKHGGSFFVFEILEICKSEYDVVLMAEQKWLDQIKLGEIQSYNICLTANSTRGYKHSKKLKKLLSEHAKRQFASPESRAKIAKRMIGKKHTQIAKDKISAAFAGKKQKRSHVLKRSRAWIGREHTEETRLKLSNAIKRWWKEFRKTGKPYHNQKTRLKISRKARKQWRNPEIRKKMVMARRKRMKCS